MSARYALYYAPRPDEPLAGFAAGWLGRDPERGIDVEQSAYNGLSHARLIAITAAPRRYGFHGTLKAPFILASDATPDALLARVADFVQHQAPFVIPRLRLVALGDFIALVPAGPVAALHRLAANCVRAFDRFRAPPDESERARLRQARLTTRQQALLARWGYPYVLEEFNFHLTLTGSLAGPERQAVYRLLEPLTAPFCSAPAPVRDLAVFVQDDGAPTFRVLARLPFAAA